MEYYKPQGISMYLEHEVYNRFLLYSCMPKAPRAVQVEPEPNEIK